MGTAAEYLENRYLLSTLVVNDDGGADHTTIQAAINAAVAGDIILINGGTDRIHTEQDIIVDEDVTIQGDAAGPQVIIQAAATPGTATDRVFEVVADTTAAIDNLTIRHGNSMGDGGGILNTGTLVLRNSMVDQNSAFLRGGGIYSLSASLTVEDATFTGNFAAQGGGISTKNGTTTVIMSVISQNSSTGFGGGIHNSIDSNSAGKLTIEKSSVSENSSFRGGGLYTEGSTFEVINSTFLRNTTTGNGGGICVVVTFGTTDVATIESSTISGNVAQFGGGLFSFASTIVITNSTFVENNSSDFGGGIYSSGSNLIFADSIFSHNSSVLGGGIYNTDGGSNSRGNLTISGSVVSQNTALVNGGGINVFSGKLTLVNSTVSQNSAQNDGGGIYQLFAEVVVTSSTLTGNRADTNDTGNTGGGIKVFRPTASTLISSTIIAGNFKGSSDTASDVAGPIDQPSANNLIGDPNSAGNLRNGDANQNIVGDGNGGVLDISTVLDTTLRNNGGSTETHRLLPGSPAIDAGSNPENFQFDQRGDRFVRTFGNQTDIGAFEVQPLIVDDDGNGHFLTIQAAIDAAIAGDTILVTGGVDRIQTEQGITANKNVMIQGIPGITQVIVQGTTMPGMATDRVFTITRDTAVQMENLVIQHGNGGIDNNGGSLTVINSTISHNSGTNGGGILNSTITSFSSRGLGGATTSGPESRGFVTIIGTTIAHNSASSGGGILNRGGTVSVTNSTITNNSASSGGGIVNASLDGFSFVAPGGSSFSTAGSAQARLTVTNSTITGNTASSDGGGIQIIDAELDLVRFSSLPVISQTTLTSSLVIGNIRQDSGATIPNEIAGNVTSAVNNLIGDANSAGGIIHGQNGNIVGNNGVGTIAVNSVLDTTLRNNGGPTQTHALIPGGPAINAGSNPEGLLFDQRGDGFPRTSGGVIDIGAFEYQAVPDLAIGSGLGIPAQVRAFSAAIGIEVFSIFPYQNFFGGVRVALGDVTGDGVNDIVTAAGVGGGPHIRVFDGVTGAQVDGPIGNFFAYDLAFSGGVYVAAADLDGDGRADIITGAGEGGGPHVKAWSGADGSLLFDFFAYSLDFRGGVRVAAGDINGNGRPDIITGAGPGGGPHVRVFEGSAPMQAAMGINIPGPLGSFFAYEATYTGGVFVAGNNTGNQNTPLIVTGSGRKIGGPAVGVFDPANGNSQFQLPIFTEVPVATFDFNLDGINDFVITTGPGTSGQVRILSGDNGNSLLPFGPPLFEIFPFGNLYQGGLFVAGSIPPALSALQVGGDDQPLPGVVPLVNLSEVTTIASAAIDRFADAGLSGDHIDKLRDVEFQITDLAEGVLALAGANTVFIDGDAAGFGFFVDASPADDLEFQTGRAIAEQALGRIDLLTVITHELGHILGLDHDDDPARLMAEHLAPGIRKTIAEAELQALDLAFQSWAIDGLD